MWSSICYSVHLSDLTIWDLCQCAKRKVNRILWCGVVWDIKCVAVGLACCPLWMRGNDFSWGIKKRMKSGCAMPTHSHIHFSIPIHTSIWSMFSTCERGSLSDHFLSLLNGPGLVSHDWLFKLYPFWRVMLSIFFCIDFSSLLFLYQRRHFFFIFLKKEVTNMERKNEYRGV